MAEFLQIDIEQETKSSKNPPGRADPFHQKVISLESIFLISNFILEVASAVFDQLSSVHKPQFALLSMLISLTVFLISIIDLVYKGKQERVSLMRKGFLPWFYHPYPNSNPFGTFPDLIGLVCAFFQWIFASIAFIFLSRNADNPIKVSIWPIFFAFGLLYTKLSGNLLQTRPVSNLRKLHREEEFTLEELANKATYDFSDNCKVGHGRNGLVYKGRLRDGQQIDKKMSSGTTAQVRLVRCPKCRRVLPEMTNIPFYQCGGCFTTLQGKSQAQTTSGLPETPRAEETNILDRVSEDKASSHEATPHCADECPSDQNCGTDQIQSRDISGDNDTGKNIVSDENESNMSDQNGFEDNFGGEKLDYNRSNDSKKSGSDVSKAGETDAEQVIAWAPLPPRKLKKK